MKDLSIIIINFHTFDLTRKCIRSILDKTAGLEFEIILIDNGSTTAESDGFVELSPKLRYFRVPSNLGFSKANNLGIKKATGEYILLLNSDTELVNNATFEGVRILKANENIGVLSGQLLNPDGTLQAVAGVFPSIKREIRELFRLTRFYNGEKRAIYYLWDQWDYNRPLEVDWVWGAFFMFRKKDLARFPDGKLHDNFFMYYEDVQWCYYFKKVLKKKVLFTPLPKAIHHLGKSDQTISENAERYIQRILPNEYAWMSMTRGLLYAKIYYLVKALFYLSLRREVDVARAKVYLRFVF